jgi:predicted esterase
VSDAEPAGVKERRRGVRWRRFPAGGYTRLIMRSLRPSDHGRGTVDGLRSGAAVFLALAVAPAAAWADRVELADGRVLDGRFANLPGVAVDPLEAEARGGSASQPVLMCDDELARVMVSKRQARNVEPAVVDPGMERIRIPQRIPETGRRVAGIGAILQTTPFDEHGRRVLTLATTSGRLDVVQGISEITPRWTRVEALQTEQPLLLDMRMATSSIPRDVLERVIATHVDPRDSDERLRVVRLLMQAERFDDARRILDLVLADFPELADLAAERKTLARLAARQLLDEIRARANVGQDQLAGSLLEGFPTTDVDGELLEEVREERDAYRLRRERAAAIVAGLRERVATLAPDVAREAGGAVDEIQRELSFSALERLATFERVGLDPSLPPDRSVAIAINGWLQGAAAGDGNLKVALSARRLRDLLGDYLREPEQPAREALLARMRNEEAFGAPTLAALAAAMRPPVPPPAPLADGLYELHIPGPDGGADIRCLVQLPPEYDPLRRYPAVVTLHASWSTPLNQIEWWAGPARQDGGRQGQAARRGTIVIAPAWAREHQSAYEYSAREHATVLAAVRGAIKRFSIDTDRIFLSGHSLGGDAAWDIALAHPDLWAGLVAVVPTADRYVTHYWPNARRLPIYVVGGELDRARLLRNATDLDRYFSKGFDVTYVEYRGRGHEHFSDDILRIFDWMGRKRRDFFPAEFEAVSFRPWDRFFWWVEMEAPPPRTVVLPEAWPPGGLRPLSIDAKRGATNTLVVRCGADRIRVWLAPGLVDFTQPLTVSVDGQRIHKGPITADETVLLEDLRLRGDRQHPFWAVLEKR